MKIFISHISEEKNIAICLKKWIDNLFLGHFEIFVSSDGESLKLGNKWLEGINSSLEDSKIMLVLCSPESILRPWINFETGCGWIKNIPVVPICHSGLKLSLLPPPLGFLQGIELADDMFSEKLLKNLTNELGVKKAPLVHQNMLRELREAEVSIQKEIPEPGIITYYREHDKPSQHLDLDDNDYINHLDTWFMSLSIQNRLRFITFADVDKQLNFP